MMVVCPAEKVTWQMRSIEQIARARYRERRGDWAGAISDYAEVEAKIPNEPDIMLAKARALYGSGDSAGAISLYHQVLVIDEFNARAANNMAYSIAESGGDLNEAEKLSRRALTIEPSNPVYLDTLGFILMKLNRHREAAEILERAVSRSESLDQEFQRSITTRLIEAFLNSDQSHLAKQVWNNQLSKDPDYFLTDELMKRISK
jgi:tetratricopeptide (TPR) repeat protein